MFDAIILANGSFPTQPENVRLLKNAPYLACCDGAANECWQRGILPDVIVGDGDSVLPEVYAQLSRRIVYVSEQMTNDLTKTFEYVLTTGRRHICILGATGKREDHTLGNIALLMEYATQADVQMVTDHGVFLPCRNGSLRFPTFVGQEISIFAFGAKSFRATGLQYEPYDFTALWQGTLNVAVASAVEITADGPFLVYCSNREE